LTEYINSHGGWTLVGWFMLGDHSDAANPNDKVQNYLMTLHLSYVQPSRKDATKDAAFVKELVDMNFITTQTAAQIVLDHPIAAGEVAAGEVAAAEAAAAEAAVAEAVAGEEAAREEVAAGNVVDADAVAAVEKPTQRARRGRPKHDVLHL
jgi:hypothetical protein